MMMTMTRIIQRHDQFFKRLLDQPGTAGALLREGLPHEVAALLDDQPPEQSPGSFVPPEVREDRTRLYRANTITGRPLLIHAVIEHKSSPDPRTGLQLLGYKTEILEWWNKNHGGPPWPWGLMIWWLWFATSYASPTRSKRTFSGTRSGRSCQTRRTEACRSFLNS